MSPTYGYVKKKTFRIGIPTQKLKNASSQQNLGVLLAGTDSENRIILILHRKEQKIFGQNCHY